MNRKTFFITILLIIVILCGGLHIKQKYEAVRKVEDEEYYIITVPEEFGPVVSISTSDYDTVILFENGIYEIHTKKDTPYYIEWE